MKNVLFVLFLAQLALSASGIERTANKRNCREQFTLRTFLGYKFGDSATNYVDDASRRAGVWPTEIFYFIEETFSPF